MKKNDWLIIISTAAYSFLFYDQNPGLNFFLFGIVIVALLLIHNRKLIASPAWVVAATGNIIASFFVFRYGTALPILANLCSMMLLSGLSFSPQSSLLIAVANSAFSVVATVPQTIKKMFSSEEPGDTERESIFKKLPLIIIPLAVTAVFFIFYRAANPVFEKYTDNIDADFISFEWIVFTAFGLLFMASLFRHYAIKFLLKTDEAASDALAPITLEEHMARIPVLSVPNELLTGVILFAMLNLLLVSVNGLDIYFMWIVKHMPEGITIAEYLHDGTDTLIVSICMAIAVILFVFRGYLNFFENNKWLKLLAYGWIAQNIVLVITTAHRNWWIIESSGLTRRRIGVYVYLLLCIIGLTTTLLKVMQRNSNWFLFRKNAWAFYAVFIISCFVNWDDFIVQYNCRHYKTQKFKYIDKRYLLKLSHTGMASLFEYYKQEKAADSTANNLFDKDMVFYIYDDYKYMKMEVDSASWKSYCISKTQYVRAVDEMIAKGGIPRP